MTQSRRMWLIGVAIATALVAHVGGWATSGASRGDAIQNKQANVDPTPRECPTCGLMPDPFGVAIDQTARLNILNRAEERGIVINWKFLDSDGNTLARSMEPMSVSPGQILSIDFLAEDHNVTRDRFGRVQLRSVVTALGGPDTKRNLQVSVEVIDNATGKTTAFIGNPAN
jgi:hypothetical protein